MAVKHPATFSRELIPQLVEAARPWQGELMLDPFAGTGKGSRIAEALWCPFLGFEIEPEWAALHPDVMCADSTQMPLPDGTVGVVVTSPAYGNRMADSYAGSPKDHDDVEAGGRIRRRTYRIYLGRPLSSNNGAGVQWGPRYRELHEQVWAECFRVLRPGGGLVLNMSDHLRKGERVRVVAWHTDMLEQIGFQMVGARAVETQRYGEGANRELRAATEAIVTFVKPERKGGL